MNDVVAQGSYLEIASNVIWCGERWTLRNYHKGNNKAALCRWKDDGSLEMLPVMLSELEEQNPVI